MGIAVQPENLLYATAAEDADLKIVDFGMATFVTGENVMESVCGTPGYLGELLPWAKFHSACPSVDCTSLPSTSI